MGPKPNKCSCEFQCGAAAVTVAGCLYYQPSDKVSVRIDAHQVIYHCKHARGYRCHHPQAVLAATVAILRKEGYTVKQEVE